MTLPIQEPINRHVADGATTRFVFTFRILTNSALEVYVQETRQIEGTDYDIENLTLQGGDVVFRTAPGPTGIPVTILRNTPEDQTFDYRAFDAFPAESHETALDKLTMMQQEGPLKIGVGLPLDPVGLFWDANGFPIRNLQTPQNDNDAATKRYVDERGGSGPGGGFNPDANYTTTGNWLNSGAWDFNGALRKSGQDVATVNQIPPPVDISGKADKTVTLISSDLQMVTVANPTLADNITLNFLTNQANSLVKLDANGRVPVSLLPPGGLTFLGTFDASSGNLPPAPATGAGSFYIISVAGTLTLLDSSGNPQSVNVDVGDYIIYNTTPATGWYFIKGEQQQITAEQVTYKNDNVAVDRRFAGTNVQTVLDEIATNYPALERQETVLQPWNFSLGLFSGGNAVATTDQLPDLSAYTRRTVEETITGTWTFSAPPRLVGSLWPAGVGLDGQVLTTDGQGQLRWQTVVGGGGGMAPSGNYTITGDWQWARDLRLSNNIAISGHNAAGDAFAQLLRRSASDSTVLGNNANPSVIVSSVRPTWLDASVSRDFTFAQQDESISGRWDFTGDPTIEGVSIRDTIQSKADGATQIQTTDTQTLTITSPTLADNVNVTARTNLANALLKLDDNGLVPVARLPITGLTFLGLWDASGGSNPTDTIVGGYYIISVAGTLTLRNAQGVAAPQVVVPSDFIVYSDSPVAGWYYVPGVEAPTRAQNVFYDNTKVSAGRRLTATNAQDAFDEIAVNFGHLEKTQVWTGLQQFRSTSGLRVQDTQTSGVASVTTGGGVLVGESRYRLVNSLRPAGIDFLLAADGNSGFYQRDTPVGWALRLDFRNRRGLIYEKEILNAADPATLTAQWTFNNQSTRFNAGLTLANTARLDGLGTGDEQIRIVSVDSANQVNLGGTTGQRNLYVCNEMHRFYIGSTSNVNNETIRVVSRATGSATIWASDNVGHKVGFRDPKPRDVGSNRNSTQADEGRVLRFFVRNVQLTLVPLAAGTTFRVLVPPGSDACRLAQGSGMTLIAANGGASLTPPISLEPNRGYEVYYRTTNEVWVFGAGMSGA